MSHDPDFADIAAGAGAVFRRMFPSPADVEAQLREGLTQARAIGGPNRGLAAALLGVMELAHHWNVLSGDDPDAVLNPGLAATEIVNAITRGING